MLERFEGRVNELESVVRELAIDITTGTVVDRIPPEKVWEETGERINVVRELIKELREYLSILKPEKVPTIQLRVTGIFERLDIFKESLIQDDSEEGTAKVSIDELRKALEEIAEFTSLCRTIQEDPSEIIQTILELRENQQTDRPPMTPAKMMRLGDLVKNARESQAEITELVAQLKGRLAEVKEEYDELYFSLSRKE
jgi:DNA-binding winged helix-turn-helix (wHTH) protein